MNRWIFTAAMACCFASFASAQSLSPIDQLRNRIAQPVSSSAKNETIPGFIVVKLSPHAADAMQAGPGRVGNATLVNRIGKTGWTLWSFPRLLTFESVQATFKGNPGVISSERLNKIYALWTDPNDTDWGVMETSEDVILNFGDQTLSFKRLWHLDDVGAQGGWSKWPNTWYTSSTKSPKSPLLAIIDTGCDMNHPDFVNAGGTGTDVSKGGQLDKGLSKFFSFGEVATGSTFDKNGHGTHVSGIALAAGNNGGYDGHGVIGTGYAARGMILRVFDDEGSGSDYDAAAAMYYAADNHAAVINLSLGTTNYSQLFQDASTYAWQKGSLVVAAGNEDGGGGGDLGPIYPAGCSGVLGVSANGPNQIPATTYSGTGMFVDVAAPGGDVVQSSEYLLIQYVFSTSMRTRGALEDLSDNGLIYPPYTRNYSYLVGTSMACPVVSGAAANYFGMKGWKQGNWNNNSAYQAIETSADSVMGAAHGGWEPYQGYGSLNMDSLMNDAKTRGADGGGMEGIVYQNGTATANVAVKAQKVGANGIASGTKFTTTTNANGYFRFDVLSPGNYEVVTAPGGLVKSKRLWVSAGCDLTGFDFWAGSYTGDDSPPVIQSLLKKTATGTTLKFNVWGFDPETGIDKITFKLGTTSGGSNTMAETEYTKRDLTVTYTLPSALVHGTTYYLTGTFINGAGMTTTKTISFAP